MAERRYLASQSLPIYPGVCFDGLMPRGGGVDVFDTDTVRKFAGARFLRAGEGVEGRGPWQH